MSDPEDTPRPTIDHDVDGWPLADGDSDLPRLEPQQERAILEEIREIAESRAQPDPDADEARAHAASATDTAPTSPTGSPGTTGPEPLTSDELRDAWALLDDAERVDALTLLPREDAEEFFISLPAQDHARLMTHWPKGHRRQWLRLLEPDDVADLMQEAGDDHRAELLALLDEPTRKEVQALMAYAEDQAGGLMNPRYARLRPQMTVDEAISYMRRQARAELESVYVAYVLDPHGLLVGVVSLRDLFRASPGTSVADIMETDVVRVTTAMDQETVTRIFAEHDLNVVPVVDERGAMQGVVTVDDIVDVVQEEATEDAQKFGGMQALEQPYLASSLGEMVKKRGVWLIVLLFGQMLTASVIGYFQGQLEKAAVLALFMPLVISSGGNAGSQASTLVIRAMALDELRIRDWWRVVRRELMTGLALGLLCGTFGLLRIILWPNASSAYGDHYVLIGVTVSVSLIGVVIIGSLAGAMLPFVLRRLGADPASASAPFVATLSDVAGLIVYFTIANLILAGTLL